MNEKDVATMIGSCGKACRLCKEYTYCSGCKSHEALGSRRRTRDGCYHYSCCRRKQIEGCWECEAFPCANDLFASKQAVYLRAFVSCIQEQGIDIYAHHVFLRFLMGVKERDYLACENEDIAMELLVSGRKHHKG